jgi:hypothetical protein
MKLLPAVTATCLFALSASAGRSAPSTGMPFYGDPPDA